MANHAAAATVAGASPCRRYVFEAPVRLWHWTNALCFLVLAVSGYFIASPLPSMPDELGDWFVMGYLRFVHYSAGYVFAILLAARLYWALAGNRHARTLFWPGCNGRDFWPGALHQLRWLLFLARSPQQWAGHNPLDQLATFAFFLLPSVFLVLSGFALYSEGHGLGSWHDRLFGWLIPLAGGSQALRTWHHLAMWIVVWFAMVHFYLVLREEHMARQTFVGTMIDGYRVFKD